MLLRDVAPALDALLLNFASTTLAVQTMREACLCGAETQDREHLLLDCVETALARARVLPFLEERTVATILQGGHYANGDKRNRYLAALASLLHRANQVLIRTNLNNGTFANHPTQMAALSWSSMDAEDSLDPIDEGDWQRWNPAEAVEGLGFTADDAIEVATSDSSIELLPHPDESDSSIELLSPPAAGASTAPAQRPRRPAFQPGESIEIVDSDGSVIVIDSDGSLQVREAEGTASFELIDHQVDLLPEEGFDDTSGSLFRELPRDALSTGGEKEYLKLKLKPTSFNNGCCFDYGNAEVSNTDTGAGHMEAVYCGDTTYWGSGAGSGPWLMADLENGLFSDNNPKQNTQDPSIGGRFCCFDYEHVEDWFDHSITALGQKRSIFVWKAMPSGKPPRRYNTLINGRPLSILKRRARVPWAHRDFEV